MKWKNPMKWVFKSQLALILMASALTCRATPYYVATTGVDDGSHGGSWAMPYATISNGVAHATTAGDVVNVSNGVYVLTTNITIQTTAITLRGQDRTNTIIQGQYPAITNRGIYLNNASATVEEFTVRGFGVNTNSDTGGGVSLSAGTLQKCIVTTNTAFYGGGIYAVGGLVNYCVISSNAAMREPNYGFGAGGVFMQGGLVANSIISNNTSLGHGAGCYLYTGGVISNCTVANNWNSAGSSSYGGGILGRTITKIYSCVIRNNSATFMGGGIAPAWDNNSGTGSMLVYDTTIEGNYAAILGGGVAGNDCSMMLTNCTISSNTIPGAGGFSGAGINCIQYAQKGMTMLWCRVVGNMTTNGSDTGPGAGIASGGDLVLDHCIIEKNVSTNSYGAGLYLGKGASGNMSKAQIRNCVISRNSSYNNGGGIRIDAASTNSFSSCTIAGNYGKNNGGGIYLTGDGSDTFTNCVIASNTLNASAADNNIYMTTSARTNSFYYSCSERLTNTAQGNITAAPVFVSSTNFHLQSGSPGINAGLNEAWMATATDMDGRPRIDRFGRRVDMGAYEFLPVGTMFTGR